MFSIWEWFVSNCWCCWYPSILVPNPCACDKWVESILRKDYAMGTKAMIWWTAWAKYQDAQEQHSRSKTQYRHIIVSPHISEKHTTNFHSWETGKWTWSACSGGLASMAAHLCSIASFNVFHRRWYHMTLRTYRISDTLPFCSPMPMWHSRWDPMINARAIWQLDAWF